MTTAEMLLEPFDIEVAMTRRILACVPEGNPEWKPHEKSMTVGRLAAHVATLPALGTLILTTPSLDVASAKFPGQTFVSTAKLLTSFNAYAAETRSALANSSDADLQYLWKFGAGDFVFSNTTRFCTFTHTFWDISSTIGRSCAFICDCSTCPFPAPTALRPTTSQPASPKEKLS